MKTIQIYITSIILIIPLLLNAQSERKDIRSGNKYYAKKKYSDAEVEYQKAVNIDSTSYAANYNLSNSYYKQEKYKQAEQQFSELLEATIDNKKLADVHFNLGNSQLMQVPELLKNKKIDEALALSKKGLMSYKNSLLKNPYDKQAKYNYMLTKELIKKLEENKQKQEQNQDDN